MANKGAMIVVKAYQYTEYWVPRKNMQLVCYFYIIIHNIMLVPYINHGMFNKILSRSQQFQYD